MVEGSLDIRLPDSWRLATDFLLVHSVRARDSKEQPRGEEENSVNERSSCGKYKATSS